MENINKTSVPEHEAKKIFFTGETKLDDLTDIIRAGESKIYHVSFLKKARTKLHDHPGGQRLIVTRGKGSLVIFEKKGNDDTKFDIEKSQEIPLEEGSMVYIPPKILHTHGSTSEETFSHIAINLPPHEDSKGNATIWYSNDGTEQHVDGILS